MLCQNCRFENPSGFKFCGNCGTPITLESTDLQSFYKKDDAERRQLTVMFCDLVGSTALSERLDPEELREIVRAYQEVCAKVIYYFEGHIAQYLGDGLLAYFGFPLAHEDDAQRAVRVGLGILKEMERLNTRLQQEMSINLDVRIGLHTGLVVVGDVGAGERGERLALGDTPNIAARIQGIAGPNELVISSTVYRLIQGYFECRDIGLHTLKGISTVVQVYRVLGESGARSRLEVAFNTGLTPLVGREKEVECLLEHWEKVKEGMGQVVLLSGEAGIGKSRLVEVMKEHVAGEVYARVEFRCLPYYQNSSLYPVIDHLQRLLHFRRDEPPEEKLAKLEKALERYGFPLKEVVPLFASLLFVSLSDRYSPLNLTPQKQRQKTFEALLAWLLKEASMQPLLFIVEDLHWVDPSTLELLTLLMDKMTTSRIFILLTFRPDFSSPWPHYSHITNLTPSRLDRKDVEVMVKKVAGAKTLPVEILHQIVAKTDGVPLFVEELTKMVIESGLLREENGSYVLAGPLPPLAIPITLQDSLMARLDRLSTVREIAQLGATFGREFTYELLQAVSPLDEATLQRDLNRLVEAEFLYQRGHPPDAKYFFKHALIQQTAYQSVLRGKRQQYHQRIAQVLEERFPETGNTQPELLAYHYTQAGFREQSIVYWHKAGEKAIERSANVEAVGHLTKGLELLRTLPDTPERAQQELLLQIALGSTLQMVKGWADKGVEQAFFRAREICQQMGGTPQLFPVLWGLCTFYIVRADYIMVYKLGEQLLNLVRRGNDLSFLFEAHAMLGYALVNLGELDSARIHFEQAITALRDSQQYSRPIYTQDSIPLCLSWAANALWLLGYPDRALALMKECMTIARELHQNHSFSLAFALFEDALHHHNRREWKLVQQKAEECMRVSEEQGFLQCEALGAIFRGSALAEQGYVMDGIEQIQHGLAIWQGIGANTGLPYFFAALAEAYEEAGKIEDGLDALARAFEEFTEHGERPYEAGLHWIKGKLLLAQSECNQSEAEACFRQAIAVARRQNAKALELRTAVSLSRLLQKQGKKEEAHDLLAEIYNWFTEGFDTVEFQEAKALLEGLS